MNPDIFISATELAKLIAARPALGTESTTMAIPSRIEVPMYKIDGMVYVEDPNRGNLMKQSEIVTLVLHSMKHVSASGSYWRWVFSGNVVLTRE